MPASTRQPHREATLVEMFLNSSNRRMPLDERCDYLKTLRKRSKETDANVDRALLQQIDIQREALRQAEKLQSELKQAHSELETAYKILISPPLHMATFLEHQNALGHQRAIVSHANSHRVVVFAKDLDPDSVQRGDHVLLSHDLNVLVEKAHCESFDTGETATFARRAPRGRLILKYREDEVVVGCSENLSEASLKAGDEIRWSRSAWLALEKIERSADDGYFLEDTPTETFEEIGGLDAQIAQVKNHVLLKFKHRETAEKYNVDWRPCFTLEGPPGTGKTMLAKALANWLSKLSRAGRSRFINIKPGGLASMWYGATEQKLRDIFQAAREAAESNPMLPVILFFDEVDSMARTRGESLNRVDDRVAEAFAVELQGLEARGNVLILAATNRLDICDPALIRAGRLGDKVIRVPRPNRDAARTILSKYLRSDIPYAGNGEGEADTRQDLIDAAVSKLYSANGQSDVANIRFRGGEQRVVKAGDLMCGASLAKVAREATESAALREIETGQSGIRLDDVLSAVAQEIEAAARVLTPSNCRHHLSDLPQDNDVVSVEPVRQKPRRIHRYVQTTY